MVETARYIIDGTIEHKLLYNHIANNGKYNDIGMITEAYKNSLDSILGLAYMFSHGNIYTKTIDDVVSDILYDTFRHNIEQQHIDHLHSVCASILNYYVYNIINLNIDNNKVLFLDNATVRGVYITEYINNEHYNWIGR